MTAAKNLKYGRGDKNFVNSDALKKYRDAQGLTNQQLADKFGDTEKVVQLWISRGRVPRVVLKQIGLSVRGPYKRNTSSSSIPAGGTIYACYVGAAEKDAFLAFCTAMKINAKDMI
jgi:hypothetical protein